MRKTYACRGRTYKTQTGYLPLDFTLDRKTVMKFILSSFLSFCLLNPVQGSFVYGSKVHYRLTNIH